MIICRKRRATADALPNAARRYDSHKGLKTAPDLPRCKHWALELQQDMGDLAYDMLGADSTVLFSARF